jgi:hypothetical protein
MVRRSDEGEAQRRRWIFYEAIKDECVSRRRDNALGKIVEDGPQGGYGVPLFASRFVGIIMTGGMGNRRA